MDGFFSSPAAWNAIDAELMQNRFLVGFGPSLKTCPKWALQFEQVTSVRTISGLAITSSIFPPTALIATWFFGSLAEVCVKRNTREKKTILYRVWSCIVNFFLFSKKFVWMILVFFCLIQNKLLTSFYRDEVGNENNLRERPYSTVFFHSFIYV